MSKWYTYDVKSKKALITLMERSKKPMTVAAGKIVDLSLITFVTVNYIYRVILKQVWKKNVEYPSHKLEVKSKGWKLPYILVFSTPMNRENLFEMFTSLATIVTSTP
jgi:hypothetical protein